MHFPKACGASVYSLNSQCVFDHLKVIVKSREMPNKFFLEPWNYESCELHLPLSERIAQQHCTQFKWVEGLGTTTVPLTRSPTTSECLLLNATLGKASKKSPHWSQRKAAAFIFFPYLLYLIRKPWSSHLYGFLLRTKAEWNEWWSQKVNKKNKGMK